MGSSVTAVLDVTVLCVGVFIDNNGATSLSGHQKVLVCVGLEKQDQGQTNTGAQVSEQ